ncbi:alpha/beta hydrolase [soil metagenome]
MPDPTAEPTLTTFAPPDGLAVRGVVLMLHGGQANSLEPVERRNGSWWRMALLARTFARAAGPAGVAVELLRYAARGWNADAGPVPGPLRDGRWAVERLAERYGDVPLVLVGHSMGGRAACALAGEPGVVGVVALAAWLTADEPVEPARGQRMVLAHGLKDRWTSPPASLEWSMRARAVAAQVARFELPSSGHFMFSAPGRWNAVVRRGALGLLGVEELPTAVQEAFALTDGLVTGGDGGPLRQGVTTGEQGLRLPVRL